MLPKRIVFNAAVVCSVILTSAVSLFSAETINSMDALKSKTNEDGKVIVVDFGAGWCPPCREFSSDIFPALEQDYKGQNVEFYVFDVGNVDSFKAVKSQYPDITSIPAVMVFSGNFEKRITITTEKEKLMYKAEKMVDAIDSMLGVK